MKLNCDLGESFGAWVMGQDAEVMPHIDMANVACGFHAGDADVMYQTLALAKDNGVVVGAHPGYQDIPGFGRRSLKLDQQQLINAIVYQVGALTAMAKMHGLDVEYVKPHGAMYNDMMANAFMLEQVMTAIVLLNKQRKTPLKLMLLATAAHQQHLEMSANLGVELLFEAFADRRYTDDGYLVPRNRQGAVLSESEMLEQVERLAKSSEVVTESGKVLKLRADTLCVHGDNAEGVAQIVQIKTLLAQ